MKAIGNILYATLIAIGLVFGGVVVAKALTNLVTSSDGISATSVTVSVPTVVGRMANVSVSPGTVSLGTKDVTVTVTGVKAGDWVICSLASGAAMTVGVTMAPCHSTADNAVIFRFDTPIVAGVTVGSFNVNIAWLE